MKIFISSDIEGTSGACNWDEALETDHHKFLGPQMTKEVAAAASAALESGAEEVLVRDAHGGALNIDPAGLPRGARLLRGWAHDIYCMMSGIDRDKYDAVLFTGYHAGAKNPGNPLSHTMHRYIDSITINGEPISEFVMNAYTADISESRSALQRRQGHLRRGGTVHSGNYGRTGRRRDRRRLDFGTARAGGRKYPCRRDGRAGRRLPAVRGSHAGEV